MTPEVEHCGACDKTTVRHRLCRGCLERAYRHLDPGLAAYHRRQVRQRKQRRAGIEVWPSLPRPSVVDRWSDDELVAAAQASA